MENINFNPFLVKKLRNGFTLLEVLLAIAIAGMAFGAFLLLSSKSVDITNRIFTQFIETVAAHNCINEIIYNHKDYNGKTVEILNRQITVKQDFENLMGFRVVKVKAGDVEVYEIR
ncbi:general secretion pathway protein I [Desulfurobacterium pacificum]|uniref:General secretion pathway protein I n=1 Tax=Desulfurobacterium pacificum TaxID=240166 RepID=A0ABY1NGW1_9BACT|nr:prepilin-type N-terminal cleavage/methylation domain-containing protein [Desulfurobacterium pacificum]SMP08477.1 general secretion pathway protein I [Desulfurobacterium pacificum]